jgi:hypothetical protein
MRFALGILLAPLLLSCAPDAPSTPKAAAARADDACTVAVRFVDSWLHQTRRDRPVVFSDTPDNFFKGPAPGAWFKRSGEYGEAPSPAMLKAAPGMTTDSAVARCPSLRAYLERAHIPYGAKAVAEAQARPGKRAFVLGLTLPRVSPDGTQALSMTSSWSGLNGLGQLFLLERQPDGGWSVKSVQTLLMS